MLDVNILWVILIITVVVGIIYLILVSRRPVVSNTYSIIIPCQPDLDIVPDVSTLSECRNIEGFIDEQRYYDPNKDWTVLILDTQIIPSAVQICGEYCSQLQLANTCLTYDSVYENCLEQLQPQGCTDAAMPQARKGATYLYVIGRGRVGCYL